MLSAIYRPGLLLTFFVDPHRFQDKSEVAVTVTIVPRDSTDV